MKKEKKKVASEALKELINRCVLLTDRQGRRVSREDTPVTCHLHMEYVGGGLLICLRVGVSAGGGGGYSVRVSEGKTVLLDVTDSISANYNYPEKPEIKTYVPGGWEKKIPGVKEITGK